MIITPHLGITRVNIISISYYNFYLLLSSLSINIISISYYHLYLLLSSLSIDIIYISYYHLHLLLSSLSLTIVSREAALRPAGGSLIAEMFPAKQRGIANGIFSWGVSLVTLAPCSDPNNSQVYFGYGFSFLFGIYLTQLNVLGYGWRATYVIAGLPGILIAVALLLVRLTKVFFFYNCWLFYQAYDPRDTKEKETVVAIDLKRKLSYGFIEVQEVSKCQSKSYPKMVLSAFTQPSMILLFLAAAFRHTGGSVVSSQNSSQHIFS